MYIKNSEFIYKMIRNSKKTNPLRSGGQVRAPDQTKNATLHKIL